MSDLITADDAFSDEAGANGTEINFTYILLRQLERCSFFLSKLDEVPHYVFAVFSRPEVNLPFDILKYQPNRNNFCNSVCSLQALLHNFVDDEFRAKSKSIKELQASTNNVQQALLRYKELVGLMKRAGLLPAEKI
jgi:hypothetical protein